MFGMFWARGIAGIGYRPFGMSVDDVDSMAARHFAKPVNAETALVFRVRYNWSHAFTTPLQEDLNIGNYHEGVLAITRDSLWHSEVWLRGAGQGMYTSEIAWSRDAADLAKPSQFLPGGSASEFPHRIPSKLMFVGQVSRDAVMDAMQFPMSEGEQGMLAANARGRTINPFQGYSKLFNNCQRSAARMRSNIMYFERNPIERVD
jgi:hypothetical protein